MKRSVLVLILALSVMMLGTIAVGVTEGQGQVSQASNERLASAWPTIVYMTSNQSFFQSNQTPCSVSDNITGVTAFWSSKDNSTIYYAVWIGAENITQVTLNLKQNGSVGQTVAYLYAPGNMTRPIIKINQTSDLLVLGNLSAGNLMGPMKGMSMSALRDNISQGDISVIASTSQCPMELRGEFGVFPFMIFPGVQNLTQMSGPCPGGVCRPMEQGPQEPIMPMGPGQMMEQRA